MSAHDPYGFPASLPSAAVSGRCPATGTGGGADAGPAVPPILPPPGQFSLPGFAPGGSVETVLQQRVEQVLRWGHTAEADAACPPDFLIPAAQERLQAARERLKGEYRPEHWCAARRALVRAAALILANIDRLDADTRARKET
jgi:hypothetical protein